MEVNNGQKTILDIKKTSTNGNIDIYTITYSDNTTTTFEVTNGVNGIDGDNGKDGTIITVSSLYEEWKKGLNEGEDNSFDAFLKEYLTFETPETLVKTISETINCAVSINCVFNYKKSSYFQGTTTEQSLSAGSGVIIQMSQEDKEKGDCYVMTNYHVVYDSTSCDPDGISQEIRVYLYGMEGAHVNIVPAKYIGGSMAHDIAILKVSGSEVLKNSNAIEAKVAKNPVVVGQDVIAIGNPEGEGISVTQGICNVKNEQVDMTLSDNMTEGSFNVIRIDAAVNPGNSGGGLFNANGELVGIVNAKIVDTKIDCIGYAIPIETANLVFDRVIETCDGETTLSPKFAKLGLMCASYCYETYYDYETSSVNLKSHIIVTDIVDGGISATLGDNGFKKKDLIVSAKFEGETYEFETMYDLSNFLLMLKEDSVIEINVKRVLIPADNNPESENYIDLEDETNYVYPNAEYEDVAIRISYNGSYFS